MATTAPVVGLLLAAGHSRRFGSDKLLQPLPGGEPLVVASARRLVAATDRTVVLIRPQQPALHRALAGLAVEVVETPPDADGMGATLATGIRATPQAAGWVVALGDMPCIAPDTLARVTAALRAGATLAAPYHAGQRGHPVGLAACWRAELAALRGAEGARHLLHAHGAAMVRIDVNDPGCLLDVDTPAAWAQLVGGR